MIFISPKPAWVAISLHLIAGIALAAPPEDAQIVQKLANGTKLSLTTLIEGGKGKQIITILDGNGHQVRMIEIQNNLATPLKHDPKWPFSIFKLEDGSLLQVSIMGDVTQIARRDGSAVTEIGYKKHPAGAGEMILQDASGQKISLLVDPTGRAAPTPDLAFDLHLERFGDSRLNVTSDNVWLPRLKLKRPVLSLEQNGLAEAGQIQWSRKPTPTEASIADLIPTRAQLLRNFNNEEWQIRWPLSARRLEEMLQEVLTGRAKKGDYSPDQLRQLLDYVETQSTQRALKAPSEAIREVVLDNGNKVRFFPEPLKDHSPYVEVTDRFGRVLQKIRTPGGLAVPLDQPMGLPFSAALLSDGTILHIGNKGETYHVKSPDGSPFSRMKIGSHAPGSPQVSFFTEKGMERGFTYGPEGTLLRSMPAEVFFGARQLAGPLLPSEATRVLRLETPKRIDVPKAAPVVRANPVPVKSDETVGKVLKDAMPQEPASARAKGSATWLWGKISEETAIDVANNLSLDRVMQRLIRDLEYGIRIVEDIPPQVAKELDIYLKNTGKTLEPKFASALERLIKSQQPAPKPVGASAINPVAEDLMRGATPQEIIAREHPDSPRSLSAMKKMLIDLESGTTQVRELSPDLLRKVDNYIKLKRRTYDPKVVSSIEKALKNHDRAGRLGRDSVGTPEECNKLTLAASLLILKKKAN